VYRAAVPGARKVLAPGRPGGIKGDVPFDPELAALLACPKCHRPVQLAADESGFACRPCVLLYPIEDGIPNFLIDEARPLAVPGSTAASG